MERLPEFYSLKELHQQYAFVCRERVNAELVSCNRAIVSSTNIGTVLKATLRETSERQSGAHMGFYEHIDSTLN